MRYILIILLFFICKLGTAQVYQLMPQYGYDAKRFNFDSTLSIPTTCGVPTLKANLTKKAAIAYDSCNKRFYYYDPKLLAWDTIKGGGGSSIDTTSLSNRINLKLNITDTSSLLRKIDTTKKFVNKIEQINGWDSIIYYLGDSGIKVRTGMDTSRVLIAKVHNAEATTLTRGTAVYLSGATGDVASVRRANNKADATSARTLGLVREDIPAGQIGYVITKGQITKLQLGAFTEGDFIYLDSIDGQFTKVKPKAPYHYVQLGIVERANNGNGLAYLNPMNGFETDEIHDIQINNILNNQVLIYSDTQGIWKNKNIYSIVDTTSLSNRINQRLLISDTSVFLMDGDSALYQTKFRSDTARTNTYTAISGREAPLTFSTGLTRSTNTITSNLSTGVSGGQSVVGGTASGNNLTLSSTTNATKGSIVFGSSAYDEANNRMGIGTLAPTNPFDVIRGTAGTMARNSFESGSFSYNADMKVGIYTSSSNSAHGAALTFAQTNLQANSRYPGFDMQYVYSAAVADNAWRLNYTERSAAGAVQNYAANLFVIYANGRAVLNPAVSGVTSSAKLFIGHNTDAGFMFDNNGTGRFSSTLTTNGNIRKVTARTSAYTALATDDLIPCDGTSSAFTITLPTASGRTGQTYTIKKTDNSANAITIGTTSSQTIDGATTYSLATQWKYVSVMSNGSNWLIIANN